MYRRVTRFASRRQTSAVQADHRVLTSRQPPNEPLRHRRTWLNDNDRFRATLTTNCGALIRHAPRRLMTGRLADSLTTSSLNGLDRADRRLCFVVDLETSSGRTDHQRDLSENVVACIVRPRRRRPAADAWKPERALDTSARHPSNSEPLSGLATSNFSSRRYSQQMPSWLTTGEHGMNVFNRWQLPWTTIHRHRFGRRIIADCRCERIGATNCCRLPVTNLPFST